MLYAMETNPEARTYYEAMVKAADDAILVSEANLNPVTDKRLCLIRQSYNEGTVRCLNLGLFSLIWMGWVTLPVKLKTLVALTEAAALCCPMSANPPWIEALYCMAVLLIWLPGIAALITLLINVDPLIMSPGPDGLCIFNPTPDGAVIDRLIPESLITPEMELLPSDKMSVMFMPLFLATKTVNFPNTYWEIKLVLLTSGKLVCKAAGESNWL